MLDMYGICMDMSPRNIQAAAPPNILLDPKKKVETKQTPGRPWWFFFGTNTKENSNFKWFKCFAFLFSIFRIWLVWESNEHPITIQFVSSHPVPLSSLLARGHDIFGQNGRQNPFKAEHRRMKSSEGRPRRKPSKLSAFASHFLRKNVTSKKMTQNDWKMTQNVQMDRFLSSFRWPPLNPRVRDGSRRPGAAA